MIAGSAPLHQPRVSIITAFFNSQKFLAETIDSVLAQTFEQWEYLLVDDGSLDGSTDVAKSYAARCDKIRYLEHPAHINRGTASARNLGLRHAQGEYVAFIDADDVWTPTKIAEQVAIMDINPEIGLVCGADIYWSSWSGGNDIVRAVGHVQDTIIYPPQASLAVYPLGTADAPSLSSTMARMSHIRALGAFEEQFTREKQLYEDQTFLAKLYLGAPVYFSSKVWLRYRQHAESCVARVHEAGKYHDVRSYFLNWLELYLEERPNTDRRVVAALRRALLPYRHPRVHQLLRVPAMLRSRCRGLRRIAGRIGRLTCTGR
jgi:glycosyltransferase involved in cell wall biosynthesis